MIRKHLGLEQIVDSILKQMGDVNKIILIGDYAQGRDSGTIEVIIIAKEIDEVYIKKLQQKLKDVIERSVVFYINSPVPENGIKLYDHTNSGSNPNE